MLRKEGGNYCSGAGSGAVISYNLLASNSSIDYQGSSSYCKSIWIGDFIVGGISSLIYKSSEMISF